MTEKEAILQAISELPEGANFEDAIERLYLLYKIERGLKQIDAGKTISHEEALQRLTKWLP